MAKGAPWQDLDVKSQKMRSNVAAGVKLGFKDGVIFGLERRRTPVQSTPSSRNWKNIT
jgi:hypothetical protein